MPVLTVYPGGSKMGTSSPNGNRIPPLRTECQGWTSGATRRNREWLMSVDGDRLTGTPVAITLTVKQTPASADEWTRLRNALFSRLDRLGLIRLHWVTEWTRRGNPHLHLSAYFDVPSDALALAKLSHQIRTGWLELTSHLETRYSAQHVVPMTNASGWFQYTAKHASRGVKHYQRQRESLPSGWKRTGRVWGYRGDWPRRETILHIEPATSIAYRRLVRSYAVAAARAHRDDYLRRNPGTARYPNMSASGVQIGWIWANPHRPEKLHTIDQAVRGYTRTLRYARRLLRVTDRRRAHLVGVMQWIPQKATGQILMFLHSQGHVFLAPEPS